MEQIKILTQRIQQRKTTQYRNPMKLVRQQKTKRIIKHNGPHGNVRSINYIYGSGRICYPVIGAGIRGIRCVCEKGFPVL